MNLDELKNAFVGGLAGIGLITNLFNILVTFPSITNVSSLLIYLLLIFLVYKKNDSDI